MPSSLASESTSSLVSPKYWLGPYAIVVSTLYLWGYWGTFEVNILEYIGIADIVKGAIYPIASAFAFFAVGAVLGEVLSPDLQPGGGAHTAVGKALHRWAPFLAVAYLLTITLYFLAGPIEKWRILPALFALAVYLPLKSTDILRSEFRSDGARSIVVFLLATLIPFAYGRGVLEANDVLVGTKYSYSTADLPGQPSAVTAKPTERLRYVGKANDRYVFFDPVGKSTSFIATSEVKALTLKKYEASSVDSATATVGSPTSAPIPNAASAPASTPKPFKAAS